MNRKKNNNWKAVDKKNLQQNTDRFAFGSHYLAEKRKHIKVASIKQL